MCIRDSSPSFSSVRKKKVIITPFLEFRIQMFSKLVTGFLCGGMPSDDVFMNRIVGGEIKTSAKPPYLWFSIWRSLEISYVCMTCGNVRIIRMENDGDSQSSKAGSGKFWSVCCRRRGKIFALDVRKVDAPFFQKLT